MGREITYDEGVKISSRILKRMELEDLDVFRLDATMVRNTTHWVARVEYAAHKGGGYQLFEGDLTDKSVQVRTGVLGRGRVTPRKQLKPILDVERPEEILDRVSREDTQLEFQSLLDEERVD